MSSLKHPNVHSAWSPWSESETLHVAVAYSNPYRWDTRRELFHDFRRHLEATANVKLYVGELAYGQRPFEVAHESDLQMRTSSELFHKENILNEVIKRFPSDWKYGAYMDADFTMNRHDWALETIHQLQHHQWVQPFSTYADLSANVYGGNRPQKILQSFAATYIDNGYSVPVGAGNASQAGWPIGYASTWVPVGATGGAWAFRREAFDTVGGLLDQCILGHADWFMTFGLVSEPTRGDIASSKFHKNYTNVIEAWQKRAQKLKKNIGVVDCFAVHHFHGAKKNRAYGSRDQILVKHQFDPVIDLVKNWHGIYELTDKKIGLRDEIRRYFISRNEDDPTP